MLIETTRRTAPVAVFVALCALASGPQHATGAEALASEPLKILLLNDDGIGAAGIRAMQAALQGVGHTVVVVAPAGNVSGAGANANLGEAFRILPADDASDPIQNEFKVFRTTAGRVPLSSPVPATPAEVVILARAVTPFVPDLVISGINDGANAGLVSFLSGTVAGASIAATKFSPFGPRPAIAVSLEGITAPFPAPVGFAQNFDDAAAFIVALIEHLQRHPSNGELLPPGIFLNVNYPALPSGNIKGVKVTSQGESVLFHSAAFAEPQALQGLPLNPFDPTQFCVPATSGGLCVAGAVPIPNNETVKVADTSAVVDGYISISPFATDYTAHGALGGVVMRLHELKY